jgi:RNA 2',3'-cyclic 3'-phosphodiesterase
VDVIDSPRVRLFVALDLPGTVLEGLGEWQRAELSADPALRPSRAETLHITLAFLGYHPEREVGRIAEAALGLEPAAPLITLRADPVAVPPSRPRLYAIDADSDETVALQSEVERRLVDAGLYEPEKRDFWPHLTVARVRTEKPPPGRRRGKPARVERPPGPLPEELLEPFRGVRVALYRSRLRPSGAEYEPLAQTELLPHGGGKAS